MIKCLQLYNCATDSEFDSASFLVFMRFVKNSGVMIKYFRDIVSSCFILLLVLICIFLRCPVSLICSEPFICFSFCIMLVGGEDRSKYLWLVPLEIKLIDNKRSNHCGKLCVPTRVTRGRSTSHTNL